MPSPYSNVIFPVANFTASPRSAAVIPLGVMQANGQWTAGSWSVAAIALAFVGTGTATFGLLGSADGGVTYTLLALESTSAPGTFTTATTATGAGAYRVNLSGITHVQWATSGTFTATSISLTLTAAPNGA